MSGAERRAAAKELQAIERRLARVEDAIAGLHERLAAHDQSDYVGLASLAEDLRSAEAERDRLEERWLAMSE